MAHVVELVLLANLEGTVQHGREVDVRVFIKPVCVCVCLCVCATNLLVDYTGLAPSPGLSPAFSDRYLQFFMQSKNARDKPVDEAIGLCP